MESFPLDSSDRGRSSGGDLDGKPYEEPYGDLYREIILDHYRNPRNRTSLEHIPESRIHENPTCGDSVKVDFEMDDQGRVTKVLFDGNGCAISTASASMMTELMAGKTLDEVKQESILFIRVMRGEDASEQLDQWGDMTSLKGVIQYPVRVKCATLAWHALLEAIETTDQ